ncbi:hypothetical protein HLH33_14075 [Gluconacetobacter diazotrophicus]|uniref:Quercetin 2,3-dioxygenase C-terminal cupin domain-containing protein n=1 Tax=Gluconacetobacter diazotrophicus TaxID=33996 RepID=A0A7W4I6Y8_GLUDI|nr:hypothetical protein [Gluconacetobacter diazotrophicus]MBB2157428.1 hypothetical protein [Gluconacetobacter diazotrophicus]
MITIRRSDTLGTAQSDGLAIRCHFAFADWQDPARMHDGRLRAVNLGTLAPGGRYRLGPEQGVDILTWLHSGTAVAHMDGFPREDVRAGGLHLAGTGRGCATVDWKAGPQGASFIQFWLLSDVEGTTPAQEIRAAFPRLEDGGFRIIASGFPEDDPEEAETIADGAPVALSACARLLHAAIPAGEGAAYRTDPDRDLYLLVVSGEVRVQDSLLHGGDAAALTGLTEVTVIADAPAVVLLADVAA